MTRRFFLAVLLAGASVRSSLDAQAPSLSWFGTWALNVPKSTDASTPSAFRRGTYTIAPWRDGVQFTYDLVRVRGGVTHLEWRGHMDGQDYPVAGIEAVVTAAYSRVDERTFSVVQKVDGQVTATATMTLSLDGRSITTVTAAKSTDGPGTASTMVYDKQ